MQKNRKFRICGDGDKDKTIDHMKRTCSRLALKEYKTRHDLVGKLTHWELCKKFKFDHTNRGYMYNQESFLENETQKLL